MNRSINTKVLDWPQFRRRSPAAKLVYLILRFHPKGHLSGLFHIGLDYLVLDTGLDRGAVDGAIRELEDAGLLRYDFDAEVVWVRHMLEDQGRGAKIHEACVNNLHNLNDSPVTRAFADTLSIPYPHSADTPSMAHPARSDGPSEPPGCPTDRALSGSASGSGSASAPGAAAPAPARSTAPAVPARDPQAAPLAWKALQEETGDRLNAGRVFPNTSTGLPPELERQWLEAWRSARQVYTLDDLRKLGRALKARAVWGRMDKPITAAQLIERLAELLGEAVAWDESAPLPAAAPRGGPPVHPEAANADTMARIRHILRHGTGPLPAAAPEEA